MGKPLVRFWEGQESPTVWTIVAPPRKQAANGEDEHRPVAVGDSCLLEGRSIRPPIPSWAGRWRSKSCPRRSRLILIAWPGSNEKPKFSPALNHPNQ